MSRFINCFFLCFILLYLYECYLAGALQHISPLRGNGKAALTGHTCLLYFVRLQYWQSYLIHLCESSVYTRGIKVLVKEVRQELNERCLMSERDGEEMTRRATGEASVGAGAVSARCSLVTILLPATGGRRVLVRAAARLVDYRVPEQYLVC